ncbi:MAG: hypothetical protein HQL15_07255 [Candidatus Omnitrophica bacterium]|nr:hypothetical protein [Candidatus Omnitrophota bacterium]
MQKKSLDRNTLQTLLFGLMGIFIFLFFFRPIETEDVWWHLSTGRWIVEHQQTPHVDIFPFANESTPWSCHNEWLGSVLLYLIVKFFGLFGLKVFRSLFITLVIGILWRYAYKKVPTLFLSLFILLASLGIGSRCFLKPDLFNVLFVQVFLISLFDHEKKGAWKSLGILPVLSCVWFNIHIGALIYGISLISIFFLSSVINYFLLKKKDDIDYLNFKRVRNLGLLLLACLGSFILNPYGLEGFLYPFKVFLMPDFIGFYKFSSIIGEMHPPVYIFQSVEYFYYFVLFFIGLGVVLLNIRSNLTLALLFIFSFLVFLSVRSRGSFFAMVCSYVFIQGVSKVEFERIGQRIPYLKIIENVASIVLLLFLMIQVAILLCQKTYIDKKVVNNLLMEGDPYSDRVIGGLISNQITGPIFNTETLGGKILWLGYPSLRPFRDGRNNSYERNYNQLVLLYHPEKWIEAEKRYGFKIVILRPSVPLERDLMRFIASQNTWQLIAIDGPWAVYVKKGEFSLPRGLNDFQKTMESRRYMTVNDLRELKQLTGSQKRSLRWQEFFEPVSNKGDLLANSQSKAWLGYQGAAVEDLIETYKVADSPEIRNAANFILVQYPNLK